jgi:hypothetical protein
MALPTPETETEIAAPIEIIEETAADVATPVLITALAVAVIPVPGA